MAHFYASIQGSRGEATRLGTKNSGISGHVRGWHVGGEVDMSVDSEGRDVATFTATGGSNGGRSVELGELRSGRDGEPEFRLSDHPAMIAAAKALLENL